MKRAHKTFLTIFFYKNKDVQNINQINIVARSYFTFW